MTQPEAPAQVPPAPAVPTTEVPTKEKVARLFTFLFSLVPIVIGAWLLFHPINEKLEFLSLIIGVALISFGVWFMWGLHWIAGIVSGLCAIIIGVLLLIYPPIDGPLRAFSMIAGAALIVLGLWFVWGVAPTKK